MRFSKYLVEESISSEQFDALMDDIHGLVEPSFLKACKESIRLFVRNTKKPLGETVARRYKVRDDRRPMDMEITLHNAMDNAFMEKFGWKARSNAVFASSVSHTMYGKPSYFFPIGPYKFVWSEKIDDLYDKTLGDIKDVEWFLDTNFGLKNLGPDMEIVDLDEKDMKVVAKKVVSYYTDKDLEGFLHTNHEIMFNCKEYMLVSYNIPPYEILERL